MNEEYKSRGKTKTQQESQQTKGLYRVLTLNETNCPNCHQTIARYYELCPHCGYRLHSNHCTFCGAPMESGDLFCGECGGSSKGIQCPHCGTLSFRSFCPNCNQAVDDLGREELQKAKEDPLYQRICALAEKIIEAQENGSFTPEENEIISPEIMNLLDQYRNIGISQSIEKSQETDSKSETREMHKVDKEIQLTTSDDSLPDLSASIEELNALLKSMAPDAGLTPQMQRNYYTARKVAVFHKTKVKEPVGWVCNLCGACHISPSECSRPELGGNWIYQEREITTKTYE